MNSSMMYSNIFFLVLFALSASAQRQTREVPRDIYEIQCINETHINPSSPSTTERQRRCLGACVLRKHGTLRENGTLDVQKEIEYLSLTEDNEIRAMNNCANEKGKDDCETVEKFLHCLDDQNQPYERMINRHNAGPHPYRHKRATKRTDSMYEKYYYHPESVKRRLEMQRTSTIEIPKE